MDQKFEVVNKNELKDDKLVIVSVYLMLFSYFYNLPALKYSLTGENELRVYDLVGVLLFYLYIKYFKKTSYYINLTKPFLYLVRLLQWSSFMLIFTFVFSFALSKFNWGIQSLLYLFHFWSFFLTAVYLSILIKNTKELSRIVNTTLVFSIITFLIVILQNFNVIPFLWSDEYLRAYNFLSGTLGPNKIVVGMTCFFVFALSIGLINEKRVKINYILLIATISLSLLTLVISGSRTSYVALLIFLIYYFLSRTLSFLYSVIILGVVILGISSFNPDIITKAITIYENRVEKKIKNPNDIKEANVDDLYEDLGSGRKGLSLMYIDYLLDKPYIIPFGVGFNNRIMIGSSAHNMYLSVINELGLIGFFLYFRWLVSYLFVKMRHFTNMKSTLAGLVLAMLVTLLFGEHLYVYRPLFGLLGLFLFVTTILLSPYFLLKDEIK